ncbi:ATP-binding protein [Solemya velesiana gill symbiont]|uniref:ATP-binding protein n=1 Tax=Solemya velesiana gill symbiont TaxID=1918948 RepID=UPI001FE4418A|nr:ATP-binding protein [Solemya velesiana gill symbiont]
MVKRLVNSLEKVYVDKGIACTAEIDESARFWGDEDDLFELVGNLLENAFKYSNNRVRVLVESPVKPDSGGAGMTLVIEDDGPGIDGKDREQVLHRGNRVDQQVPGQGIGLSVAHEIIALYGGTLHISSSEMGGAMIVVALPSP